MAPRLPPSTGRLRSRGGARTPRCRVLPVVRTKPGEEVILAAGPMRAARPGITERSVLACIPDTLSEVGRTAARAVRPP